MNKLLVKILIPAVALIFCAILYTVINAQSLLPPDHLDDMDYGRCSMHAQKVTTEFIECSANSSEYTRINISRNYGVPRFGILTDCAGQTHDTIWYIPDSLHKTSGGYNGPDVTRDSITVYWRQGQFTVQVMDVQTGSVVVSETRPGQPASMFEDEAIAGFTLLEDTVSKKEIGSISFGDTGWYPRKDNNPGRTIDYSHLQNGLYWVYVYDNLTNEIYGMYKISKGLNLKP